MTTPSSAPADAVPATVATATAPAGLVTATSTSENSGCDASVPAAPTPNNSTTNATAANPASAASALAVPAPDADVAGPVPAFPDSKDSGFEDYDSDDSHGPASADPVTSVPANATAANAAAAASAPTAQTNAAPAVPVWPTSPIHITKYSTKIHDTENFAEITVDYPPLTIYGRATPFTPTRQDPVPGIRHKFRNVRGNPPGAIVAKEWDMQYNRADSFVQCRVKAPFLNQKKAIAAEARNSGKVRALAIQMLVALTRLPANFQDTNP